MLPLSLDKLCHKNKQKADQADDHKVRRKSQDIIIEILDGETADHFDAGNPDEHGT